MLLIENLPTLESAEVTCQGCGACCRHMVAPPFHYGADDPPDPAIPGEVPLVEGCVGCQLLGLEVG